MNNHNQNPTGSPYQMNRRNEDQYGVVRAVREYDEFGKKKLHPQKRFFADNLHHKSQAIIYGKQLKKASENSAKGDHLFFEPNYSSEYNKQYDQLAKKFMHQYLSSNINQNMQPDIQLKPEQVGPGVKGDKLMGQRNFFTAEEHSKFNSHWKRQEFLKGQWKIQDMDPENSIKKEIMMRQKELLTEGSPQLKKDLENYHSMGGKIPRELEEINQMQMVDDNQKEDAKNNFKNYYQDKYDLIKEKNAVPFEKPAVSTPLDMHLNQQADPAQMEAQQQMENEIMAEQQQQQQQQQQEQQMQQEQQAQGENQELYQQQMDNNALIMQCKGELDQLNKAEAQMDEQAKQSSYGLLRDNQLVRSQERPQGKMVFPAERYEQPSQPFNMMEQQQQSGVQQFQNPDMMTNQEIMAQVAALEAAAGPGQPIDPGILFQELKKNRPNQRYSLEQMRFLNKIKNASKRMNDMYKLQSNQNQNQEKVKYAMLLEKRELQNIGANTEHYSPENLAQRQPLGKVVTQVEMTNAEARQQLREMLEHQIREKERTREQDQSQREKIYHNTMVMKDPLQLQREMEVQKSLEFEKQQAQFAQQEEIGRINQAYRAHMAPGAQEEQFLLRPPMPPTSVVRQNLAPLQAVAGLNSRRNKYVGHRYESRHMPQDQVPFAFEGDVYNAQMRRQTTQGQVRGQGGAGVGSTAQSYGHGSPAMAGLVGHEGLPSNQAQVADQYFTTNNSRTIPAGVLGLAASNQPGHYGSQSQPMLPPIHPNGGRGRPSLLPPVHNPSGLGAPPRPPSLGYGTPQNMGQRAFNFSAQPTHNLGGMPGGGLARTLSRGNLQRSAQQNLL